MLYFPTMYVTHLSIGIVRRLIESVPTVTRAITEKKCARMSTGFSRFPRSAVGGKDTLLKDVIA
jgi:hypothetical protein